MVKPIATIGFMIFLISLQTNRMNTFTMQNLEKTEIASI